MTDELGEQIFAIAKQGADKVRVRAAYDRVRHVRTALLGFERETDMDKIVGELIDMIDKDLSYIELQLASVVAQP